MGNKPVCFNQRKFLVETHEFLKLKLASALFYIFTKMMAHQKLWKMLFVPSEMLFSFLRFSNFCNVFPSFPQSPDSKGQMKVEYRVEINVLWFRKCGPFFIFHYPVRKLWYQNNMYKKGKKSYFLKKERAWVLLKNGTRDFQNSPPFWEIDIFSIL